MDNNQNNENHISESTIRMLTILAISILLIYAANMAVGALFSPGMVMIYLGAPIIAIAWMIAMNVPSWLPITGALYQDMVITEQEKSQFKSEILIDKVKSTLDQCETDLIQDVFVDSIYGRISYEVRELK